MHIMVPSDIAQKKNKHMVPPLSYDIRGPFLLMMIISSFCNIFLCVSLKETMQLRASRSQTQLISCHLWSWGTGLENLGTEAFYVHVANTHFTKYRVGASLPIRRKLVCWGKNSTNYCNLINLNFLLKKIWICTFKIPLFCSTLGENDRTRVEIRDTRFV